MGAKTGSWEASWGRWGAVCLPRRQVIFVIRRFRDKDIGSRNFEEGDKSERDSGLSSIIAVL